MISKCFGLATIAALVSQANAHFPFPKERLNVILTNDDGWAVALVHAQKAALEAEGYNTVLSAPAENESGTGSSEAPPTKLTIPCEFDTCPVGSPPEGFNASDRTLNYVNSFPVDAVRFGIQKLAPKFFHGRSPDIVVAGPNVGTNLGTIVQISGTVGAATEAALEGIPAIAFSSTTGSQVSFTTLQPGDSSHTIAAVSAKLTKALVSSGKPFLPRGIALNVNYPAATGHCAHPSAFKFVLTRILANPNVTDVHTCNMKHLPTENSIINSTTTCQSTVSVFNATGKVDVDAHIQGIVLEKLRHILTCP